LIEGGTVIRTVQDPQGRDSVDTTQLSTPVMVKQAPRLRSPLDGVEAAP
jgi:hypothetical protein